MKVPQYKIWTDNIDSFSQLWIWNEQAFEEAMIKLKLIQNTSGSCSEKRIFFLTVSFGEDEKLGLFTLLVCQ